MREQEHKGETIWTFTTVSHERLKSAPAKVTRRDGQYAVLGAAWGAPIARVEIQVDNAPWMATKLHSLGSGSRVELCSEDEMSTDDAATGARRRGYAWRFWSFDWGKPVSGEHTIRSRAFDVYGNMQPAPDDPFLSSKVTYWENNGQITRKVLIQ